ncbi:MAG: hypothetical protein JXQ29_14920 [Planctomycetes bacterium]|nr:hypothetical protein [Planctomycetota bacterium]
MQLSTIRRKTAARRGLFGAVRYLYHQTLLRPVLYALGLLHLRRGRLLRAESCLCRAVLIAPRSFNARVQLGRTYFLMADFCRAEQQFHKAHEIDPTRLGRESLPDSCGDQEAVQAHESPAHRPPFGEQDAEELRSALEESALAPPAERPAASRWRFGDFSSDEEWERLRALPPITRAEIENTDWDRVFSDPTA